MKKSPVLLLVLALAACGSCSGTSEPSTVPVAIPSRATAATFDVATWNLRWFGDTGSGPDDEMLQRYRVRDVIEGATLDLWGLEEVVGRSPFTQLVAELPGYAGLLADDAFAEDVSSRGGRFTALAHLAMNAPDAAAEEATRAVTELGFPGVMLFSNASGVLLFDDRFLPVFDALNRVGSGVHAHAHGGASHGHHPGGGFAGVRRCGRTLPGDHLGARASGRRGAVHGGAFRPWLRGLPGVPRAVQGGAERAA